MTDFNKRIEELADKEFNEQASIEWLPQYKEAFIAGANSAKEILLPYLSNVDRRHFGDLMVENSELKEKLDVAVEALTRIHNRYAQCEDCMARENIATEALNKIRGEK